MKNKSQPKSPDSLQSQLDIATAAFHRSDYPLAAKTYETVFEQAKAAGFTEIAIKAKIGSGDTFRRQNKYHESLSSFEQSIQMAGEIQNHALISTALSGKGNAFRMACRFNDGLSASEDALKEGRTSGDHQAIAIALNTKGSCLRLLSRYEEALADYDEALAENRVCNDPYTAIVSYCGKGDTLNTLNRYEEAIKCYEDAMFENQACEDRLAKAYTLGLRGDSLRGLGRYEEALFDIERALALSRASGDRVVTVQVLGGKARTLKALEQNEQALIAYEEAYTLAQTIQNELLASQMLFGKGLTLKDLERNDEALAAFEDGLRFSRSSQDSIAEANCLIGIGEMLEKLTKDPQRCAQAFKEASTLGRQFSYGYAITRGQAGLRRLEKIEKQATSSVEHTEQPSEPSSDVPPNLHSVDKKAASQSVVQLESRVVSVFGPHSVTGLPNNQADRELKLKSMLPDKRVWTVTLMCDIRGYTTAMAQTDPEEQLEILNRYLAKGTQLIQAQGGGVDKYMGDAILGFFLPTNVEAPSENDFSETVKAAIVSAISLAKDPELTSLFSEFQSRYTNLNSETFGIGIGLAAGWAKFGEIGAHWRREYTLIGRPVNLVSRVQGEAEAWEVLSTRECWNKLSPHAECNKFLASERTIKGKMKGYENESIMVISQNN